MDPTVAPSAGSTTPGETRSDLEATLRRIEARLERLEQTLDPITQATTAAPAVVSMRVLVASKSARQPTVKAICVCPSVSTPCGLPGRVSPCDSTV